MTPLGNNTYRFTFPARPNGSTSVAFAGGHGIADTESPPVPFAGASWTYTVDPNAPLEPVGINEVVAANVPGGLADEDGDFEDWVELLNTGTASVNLGGWSLTDDAGTPAKWILPARTLAPGQTANYAFRSSPQLKPGPYRISTLLQDPRNVAPAIEVMSNTFNIQRESND